LAWIGGCSLLGGLAPRCGRRSGGRTVGATPAPPIPNDKSFFLFCGHRRFPRSRCSDRTVSQALERRKLHIRMLKKGQGSLVVLLLAERAR